LVLGPPDPIITEILSDHGYLVAQDLQLPIDLSIYNVVIATATPDDFQDVRSFVEDGGGYAYLASAAMPADLEANYQWIGARSLGFSGAGDSVTISMDNPLGTSLLEGDVLKQQAPEQSGAVWVDSLEPGAGMLANYSGGKAFAYSYQHGQGKVYFQSDADHGIAGDVAKQDIKYLLEAGILWATSDIDLGSQDDPDDFLPDGTTEDLGREPPSGSYEVVFSGQGQDTRQFPDPADPARSIFVNVNSEVVGATLFFESAGMEYRYHVQPDSGALLTFSSEINITNVMVAVEDQLDMDGSIQPAATVGYEIVRSPPACFLPAGASSSGSSAIPSDATLAGSPGATVGSTLDLPGIPIPLDSFFVGLDRSDATGFVVNFESGGVGYSCPITPSMVEVSFDEPSAISDINIENVGPWGVIGYSEPPEQVNAYVKYSVSKAVILPAGVQVHTNSTPPEEVYTIGLGGQMGIFAITGPADGEVASMWIQTGGELTEPYLYFRADSEWYSTTIDQGAGTLFTFSDDTEIDELYISFNSALDAEITVGYTYPVSVIARAGSDLSVEELQMVYLDGSASTGRPGGLSFAWSQVGGPDVDLRGVSTESASFAAPRVDESGARLVFKLVVRDLKGHESSDLVTVRVKDDTESPNEPPIVREIAVTTANEGDKVVITASAFDPEGGQVSYLWTQLLGVEVSVTGMNTPTLSFDAPAVSEDVTLSFRVEAIDEEGNGSSETADVLVKNLPEVVVVAPPLSAQSVSEGASVILQGTYGESSGHAFRWVQVAGTAVTLSDPASLNASFVAPAVDDGTEEVLRFQLAVVDGEIVEQSDEVSIAVQSVIVDNGPGDIVQPTETIGVIEPALSPVMRVDVVPPADVFDVIFQSSEVQVTQPAGQIYGIWANMTGDYTDLRLYFSFRGVQYYTTPPTNQAFAYVFSQPVELKDIKLAAIEPDGQSVLMGYYYGPVPLAIPSFFQPEDFPIRTSGEVPVNIIQSPANPDPLIAGFISRNLMLAGIMAVGVPSGIAVALKVASNRRSRQHGDPRKAAKLLFPKSDPVAGEAEKVRPVIEELERMLGRDLDTAISASELLDRFGSGSRNGNSDR
jgi:hypothetical protein